MGKDEEVATDFAEWIRPKPKCLLGVKLVGAGGASGREDIKENERGLTLEPWKGFNLKVQDTANGRGKVWG